MSDTKMPEWPERDEWPRSNITLPTGATLSLIDEVGFANARADAAMARLRVAVEAIHELKRLEAWVGDDMDSETEMILSNAEWALKGDCILDVPK